MRTILRHRVACSAGFTEATAEYKTAAARDDGPAERRARRASYPMAQYFAYAIIALWITRHISIKSPLKAKSNHLAQFLRQS